MRKLANREQEGEGSREGREQRRTEKRNQKTRACPAKRASAVNWQCCSPLLSRTVKQCRRATELMIQAFTLISWLCQHSCKCSGLKYTAFVEKEKRNPEIGQEGSHGNNAREGSMSSGSS